MNYLLDLIVIAIIAAVALISARRGFVRVVIELAGFIAAILITLTISTPLASLTYDKIIEPPIVSSVSKATGDSVTQITDDTWNALPEFIRKYSENVGFSKENINKSINENMGNGAVSAAKGCFSKRREADCFPLADSYLCAADHDNTYCFGEAACQIPERYFFVQHYRKAKPNTRRYCRHSEGNNNRNAFLHDYFADSIAHPRRISDF